MKNTSSGPWRFGDEIPVVTGRGLASVHSYFASEISMTRCGLVWVSPGKGQMSFTCGSEAGQMGEPAWGH